MPQQLFNIADLLLRDDDTTIRSQAAECIGIAFQAGYPICQEKAEKSLWCQAIERFSTSDVFAQQLLAEMMDPHDIGECSCENSNPCSPHLTCRTITQGAQVGGGRSFRRGTCQSLRGTLFSQTTAVSRVPQTGRKRSPVCITSLRGANAFVSAVAWRVRYDTGDSPAVGQAKGGAHSA